MASEWRVVDMLYDEKMDDCSLTVVGCQTKESLSTTLELWLMHEAGDRWWLRMSCREFWESHITLRSLEACETYGPSTLRYPHVSPSGTLPKVSEVADMAESMLSRKPLQLTLTMPNAGENAYLHQQPQAHHHL